MTLEWGWWESACLLEQDAVAEQVKKVPIFIFLYRLSKLLLKLQSVLDFDHQSPNP